MVEAKWIPGLRKKFEFLAGHDPDPSVQEKIKDLKGIVADSFDDLLNIKDIEAVIIASPPKFHADQAVAVDRPAARRSRVPAGQQPPMAFAVASRATAALAPTARRMYAPAIAKRG